MLRDNKTRRIILSAVFFALFILTGCSYLNNMVQGHSIQITGKTFPKTNAKDVILVYMNNPDKSSICADQTRIGVIRLQPYDSFGKDYSHNEMDTKMKKAGASIGANVIYGIAGGDDNSDLVGYAIHCL